MKLSSVSIAGYRSLRQRLEVNLDGRITVILGANDHGKTNLLHAIRHLNPDQPFDPERDLNWDYEARGSEFPSIQFTLALTDEERALLGEKRVNHHLLEKAAEFRKQLSGEAASAEATRVAADETLQRGSQAVTETVEGNALSESDTGQPPPDTEKTTANAAAEQRDAATRARDEAASHAETALRRVALAYAEEVRLAAQIKGEPAPDLASLAKTTQEAAAAAVKAAARANAKAQTARTAADAAATGTDAATKAEADAKAAEALAATSAEDAEQLGGRSRNLTAAAEAAALAESGQLAFAPDAPFPTVADPGVQDVPHTITLSRVGVEGTLQLAEPLSLYPDIVMQFMLARLPRVEVFQTQENIPDSATTQTIDADQNDFMRGIFYYAGLSPAEWSGVFNQTDATSKRLDDASENLNETLKATWSQGEDLDFQLRHNRGEIDLLIKDPAVMARKVRASRRSSGFTHFFALQTMLYARLRARPASSYLWLFDEPGVYLHPGGQHDLLQVLETLAQSNQLAYVTHSIFMINKNYPTRHRLLIKDGAGTRIDHKPYSGRWRNAIDALGMSLPGSFLFASKVLLTEGDSDPIFLNADLRKLIELGDLDVDLNPFAAISTGESQNAGALIRLMQEATPVPAIVLLFDGDKGGAARVKGLAKLVESLKLQTKVLDRNTAIEDHLLAPSLYCEAVIQYAEALGATDVGGKIRESFAARIAADPPVDLAKWARDEAWNLTGLDEDPSPVGIARQYLHLLGDASVESLQVEVEGRQRSLALGKWLAGALDLQPQTVEERRIFESAATDSSTQPTGEPSMVTRGPSAARSPAPKKRSQQRPVSTRRG